MSPVQLFRNTILVAAFFASGLTFSVASAETEIRVGVYNFPPIASITEDNQVTGLLADTLERVAKAHQDIRFRIIHTSPQRRHLDFEAGLYDVIFFESPEWGWENHDFNATMPILTDEDVYLALKKPGRDASFFDDVNKRRIVAISGYHYGFANLETNNAELEKRFDIEFSDSHRRNINLIKADRPSVAEVAIVSRAYLQKYLERHPEDWDTFLVSEVPDQSYRLSIITHPDAPVDDKDMIRLFEPLMESGQYRQLVEQWGLQLPSGFLTSFPYQLP
ncbi:transporter substrate-binding domain-containing protein [uncultured Marinobacter sp.]|uniref:substrate-binding periplasmic protein n=1 Tax=uncultured Marinobacter sp. TaxID=187379 RepID=UPI002628D6A5|nr:transporter substrate-binding domain-containing protein [uncultured Marinobacter sp.]